MTNVNATWLENETITEPHRLKGEHFRGRLTLAYDAKPDPVDNVLEDIVVEGSGRSPGGSYAVYVPWQYRPHARFVNADVSNADKGFFAQHVGVFGGEIHHCADGFFMNEGGWVHMEGGRTHSLGGLPGDHSDGFQVEKGSRFRVRNWNFDLADKEDFITNSCVFIQAKLGFISRGTIEGCRFVGGNYLVYVEDAKYGAENITLAFNHGSGWRFGAPINVTKTTHLFKNRFFAEDEPLEVL